MRHHRHATPRPCRHPSFVAMACCLRAPGLVLWLSIVGCTWDVSVCVVAYLSMTATAHLYSSHVSPPSRHHSSLSASVLWSYGLLSASSWARSVAEYRGMHLGCVCVCSCVTVYVSCISILGCMIVVAMSLCCLVKVYFSSVFVCGVS